MQITSTFAPLRTLGNVLLSPLGRVAGLLMLGVIFVGCSQEPPKVIVSDSTVQERIAEVHAAAKDLRAEYEVLKLKVNEVKGDRAYARTVLEGADRDIAARLNFIITMTNDLIKNPSSYNLIRVQWELGETAKLMFDQSRRVDRLKE